MSKYTVTHRLKKDFVASSDEIYKKGTPLCKPKLHRKHCGFCCNVAFLSEKGELLSNRQGAASVFSFDFFRPFKSWFEPVT